jgi:hypothetical protein
MFSRWLTAVTLAAAGVANGPAAVAQTPEQQKLWEEQRAQAHALEKARAEQLARQREARRADPMSWVRTLDPLSTGGWEFRSVGTDGAWAIYSTLHQLKRSGHSVTAWLRQEFPEPQRNAGGDVYSSDVQKIQYDCAKELARVLLVIYYTDNNLAGAQQTDESDIKQLSWDPIVPGTQSELMFRWACKS